MPAPYYTVAWGDTLYSTGKRFGIAWQSIASANGIPYSYIYAGQRLYIPCSGTVPPPPPPSNTTRITFPAGSNEASAAGTTSNSLPANYILTAQAGQTMTVNVIPASGQALLSISGANGKVLKSAGAGSSSWSGVLPLTQDYFIAVSAPGGSAVDYTLQVTIPPL